jgi:hypothetical protein
MSKTRTQPRRLFKARRQSATKPAPALGLFDRAMLAVEREDAAIEFLTKPGPCAVCGRETQWLATRVAHPPDAQALGAAPGKSRVITCHLCERCSDSDGATRLEASMWEDLGGKEPSPLLQDVEPFQS